MHIRRCRYSYRNGHMPLTTNQSTYLQQNPRKHLLVSILCISIYYWCIMRYWHKHGLTLRGGFGWTVVIVQHLCRTPSTPSRVQLVRHDIRRPEPRCWYPPTLISNLKYNNTEDYSHFRLKVCLNLTSHLLFNSVWTFNIYSAEVFKFTSFVFSPDRCHV